MKIIVLSNDRLFAESLLALSSSKTAITRTLFVLDMMHIDNFAHALASITPGENHTLAFVVNHVAHLDFIEPFLLQKLSKNINIAVIARKAQLFEFEALLVNPRCHIKHGTYSEKSFSPPEATLIETMGSSPFYSSSRESMSEKSLSAHKRKLMKKSHIASNAELYDVLRKNNALCQALCEVL